MSEAIKGQRRKLDFQSEAEVVSDINRLRAGNRKVAGKWTFGQTCWHLALPVKMCLRQPATTEPNDAQRAMHARLDELIAARGMPEGLPAPAGTEPPADAGPDAADDVLADLAALTAYENTHVDFGPFGPVPVNKFREFVLIHAAHHLSFFEPTS
jgi:hypothetical protein